MFGNERSMNTKDSWITFVLVVSVIKKAITEVMLPCNENN